MKRWLVSTTSTLALLALGSGRAVAAPVASVSDSVLAETIDQSDVVRQSLSVGAPAAPVTQAAGTAEAPLSSRSTIVDPTSQTPTATFTFRPVVPVRGDAGMVGSLTPNSPANPGNVSNLTGTIGGGDTGLFSVPATGIAVNDIPNHASDYMFRPAAAVDTAFARSDTADLVPRDPSRDSPAHSVFIGVPPAFGDVTAERAAREASIIGATGSATPTVRITPLPGQGPANHGLGYQVDPGPTTTIGFSTTDLRPTTLRLGAAATTTLGYTYIPLAALRDPTRLSVATTPHDETLSATITAPDGGPARRAWYDRPTVARDLDDAPVVVSTVSAILPLTRGAPNGVSIDTYPIAEDSDGGIQRLTIPIQIRGTLGQAETDDRSLLAADENESDFDNVYLRYGLLAAVVLIPPGLALLAYRIVRRVVLRRLGPLPPSA